MRVNLQYLFFSAIIIAGCSSVPKAVRTSENLTCPTTVEGYLHSNTVWNDAVPAILVNLPTGEKIYHGKLVEQTGAGIRFDPNREGPFLDPPEKLYTYDEIICAIDGNNQVIHGKIPEEKTLIWSMELQLVQETKPEATPIKLILNSNEKFSYCLAPGKYIVNKMLFWIGNQYIDEAVNLPELTLEVKEGYANYIGDLYLDFESPTNPDACVIPYQIKYRPTSGAYAYGLIGALIASEAYKNAAGAHTLTVKDVDGFKAAVQLQQTTSLLHY